MDEETKKRICNKLDAIYSLTDEILETVNKEGKVKLRYPYGIDQKDLEEAICEYIESNTNK